MVTIGEVRPEDRKLPFGSMANVPDGSVYVAVDESTADGTLVANRPTRPGPGASLHGGRFTFRDGRLVGAKFASGGAAFRHAFGAAGVGKDRPSFLEIGLDPAITDAPLLEEAERGAVSVGVGSNASFGGKTRVDFLSYLTVAGADLSIDDRPLVRRGRLVGP